MTSNLVSDATRSILTVALSNRVGAEASADARISDYYGELVNSLATAYAAKQLDTSGVIAAMQAERKELGAWSDLVPMVGQIDDKAKRNDTSARARFALVVLFAESDTDAGTVGWTPSDWHAAYVLLGRAMHKSVVNADKVARIARRHADASNALAEVRTLWSEYRKANPAKSATSAKGDKATTRTDAQRIAVALVELEHLAKNHPHDAAIVAARNAVAALAGHVGNAATARKVAKSVTV